nr:hypothetical protein CFP56_09065 [Quercus suber]
MVDNSMGLEERLQTKGHIGPAWNSGWPEARQRPHSNSAGTCHPRRRDHIGNLPTFDHCDPNVLKTLSSARDAHYYFSDPNTKPPHHRFERGSYIYLYHNHTQGYAKIEVANNAGTSEQDAFAGYLNIASLDYSYNQPTRFNLNVSQASSQDHSKWHLPSFNEKNEQKYLYKIHTLDIYLWTEKDAAAFLNHLKSIMPSDRMILRDVPVDKTAISGEHRETMSPVVQQLERTAIGSHFPPRAESAVSLQSLPGPPTPAGTSSPASLVQQPTPAPVVMAYNPAAPAAPERIQYREKTPPPLDDGRGTGLGHAAKYDNLPVAQYANAPGPPGYQSSQPTPQSAYFTGPPQSNHHQPHGSIGHAPGPPGAYGNGLPPPPPAVGFASYPQQQSQSVQFAPPPIGHPVSPPPQQQNFNRQSSYTGAPPSQNQQPTTQYAGYPTSGFGPSIQSPGMPPTPSAPPAYGHYQQPLQSPGLPPPPPGGPPSQSHTPQPPQLQHQHSHSSQLSQPVHSYSNYNYANAQQAPQLNQHGAYTGDVHNQVYRPTEGEAAHGHHAKPKPERQGSGKLEEKMSGVEKRVGGFLKRLDKLI